MSYSLYIFLFIQTNTSILRKQTSEKAFIQLYKCFQFLFHWPVFPGLFWTVSKNCCERTYRLYVTRAYLPKTADSNQ